MIKNTIFVSGEIRRILAAHIRHHEIKHDHIRFNLTDVFKSEFAVFGLVHVPVCLLRQKRAESTPHEVIPMRIFAGMDMTLAKGKRQEGWKPLTL